MTNELSLWIKKIFLILIFALVLYILYVLRSLVLTLVISGFLTVLINPLAEKGEKRKIPSWLTVAGVYIVILILASVVIGTLIPIIVTYVSDTVNLVISWVNNAQKIYIEQGIAGFHVHPYIEKLIVLILGEQNIGHTLDIIKQNAGNIQSFLTTQISSLTSGGLSLVSAVGGAVANWFLIGIMTFLMVLERKSIGKFILDIAPKNLETYIKNHYQIIQHVCTSWIKATLILSGSIFAITYIGLLVLQWIFGFSIDRTFTLALIGGIMEFIPYVGPLIALIPAVIIGLGISWEVALIITILYLVIQRVENDFLVPYVMSKNLDLSPFLVFVAMIAGASLGGVMGIILAMPVVGVAKMVYSEYKKGALHIEKKQDATATKTPMEKHKKISR